MEEEVYDEEYEQYAKDWGLPLKNETSTKEAEEVNICNRTVNLDCVPHYNISVQDYFLQYLKDTGSIYLTYIPSTYLYMDFISFDY